MMPIIRNILAAPALGTLEREDFHRSAHPAYAIPASTLQSGSA
jgi:hypothetical protein